MQKVYFGFRGRTWLIGAVLLGVMGLIASGFLVGDAKCQTGNPHSALLARLESPPAGSGGYAKELSKAFREAANRVLPSVVMIKTASVAAGASEESDEAPSLENPFKGTPFEDMFEEPRFRRFFREFPSLPRAPVMGMGSGVIIDESGVVLTNNHVVAGGKKITVRLHDGREFDVQDVKTDPKTDLAVLTLRNPSNLKAARLGDSDAIEVGDWVLALGQPFGLEGTVTAGIISAKGRGLGLAPRESFLQTDAAVNPGNSGGPLVNLEGEVIGINTAISTRTGAYDGVGFAVPINLAKWVAKQLIESGTVRRAYLGVVIQPVTHELAEQFGVKVNEGVVVSEVFPDTPAEKAGLKPGDVILRFAGKPVASPNELQGLVEAAPIGQRQELAIVRDRREMSLSVTLQEQPKDYGLVAGRTGRRTPGRAEASQLDKLGIEVDTLTADVAQQLGLKANQGVVITRVKPAGPAAMAGLEPGMVILEANRKPIRSVEELQKILDASSLEKGLLLLVQSREGTRFVVIRIGA